MKQAGEAPIKRADDHQAGCEYIKVFHSAKFFLSFVSGRLCQPQFDLKEKLFYCEEHTGRCVSSCGKNTAANSSYTKTISNMATETITTGLKKYAIGSKLRRLRLRKSMGLLELSKHTGLSPALLSKLERDLMHPTLPTLLRIAMVFSVGLEYFFNPEPRPVLEIVRKKDRLRFPESQDAAHVSYYFESLDFPVPDRALNSYFAEFEPVERRTQPFSRASRHRVSVRTLGKPGIVCRERPARTERKAMRFTSTAAFHTPTAGVGRSALRPLSWRWKRQGRRRTAAVVFYDFGRRGSWSSCISPTSGSDPVNHPLTSSYRTIGLGLLTSRNSAEFACTPINRH